LDFSCGSPFTVLQTQQGNWRYQANALIEPIHVILAGCRITGLSEIDSEHPFIA
jgi:hypothetical protein